MNGIGRALVIPGVFAAAALVSRALVARAPARLAPDFAQPLVVVTNWGAFGAALLVTLLLALAAATVIYWRIVHNIGGLSLAGVAATCALSLAAAWAMPVIFSSDVYAYAAYGELARIGANPYAHETLSRGNAIFDAAIWQWGNPPPICVYGPAFVAIARAIVTVWAPLGTLAQLDGLRALAAAALLLCVPLAYGAYPGDPAQRRSAAATIGLNPAAIWCAAEGHNDALAIAIALTGFVLARRGMLSLGAATVGLSALTKLPGAAAAVALAITNPRARLGAAAGVAVAAAFSLPLLASVTSRLMPYGRYSAQASFQAVVGSLAWLVLKAERPAAIVSLLITVALAALLAAGGAALLRRQRLDGWLGLAFAAWVLLPNPYPWYGIWLVALAALAPGSRLAAVALALSLTSLLRYVPDAIGTPNALGAVALGVGAVCPLLALLPRRRFTGRIA